MPLSIAWLALRQKTGVRCLQVLGFFGWAVLLFLNWVYEQFFCPFELSYGHHWGESWVHHSLRWWFRFGLLLERQGRECLEKGGSSTLLSVTL